MGDFQPRTVKVYREAMGLCARDIGAMRPLDRIDGAELRGWLQTRYGGASPWTFNRVLGTLRSFVTWAADQGWAEIDLGKIKRRKTRRDLSKALSRERVAELLKLPVPTREKALWTLLYESAARAEEALGLDIADLDLPNRRAWVTGKGGQRELISWETKSARLLPALIKGRTTGPVFTTRRRVPARAELDMTTEGYGRLSYRQAAHDFTRATGATLHQLRHSRLTHLAEDNLSLSLLLAKSRHRNLSTLQLYAKPGFEALQRWEREHDPSRRR